MASSVAFVFDVFEETLPRLIQETACKYRPKFASKATRAGNRFTSRPGEVSYILGPYTFAGTHEEKTQSEEPRGIRPTATLNDHELAKIASPNGEVPAIVVSKSLVELFQSWIEADTKDSRYSKLEAPRLAKIDAEMDKIEQEIIVLKPRTAPTGGLSTRRIQDLQSERAKLKDEYRHLQMYLDTVREDRSNARLQLLDDLERKFERSGLLEAIRHSNTDKLDLDRYIKQFVENCETDSDSDSRHGSSGGSYTQSVIMLEVRESRQEVEDAQEDRQGRIAYGKVHAFVEKLWGDGYNVPPDEVVQSLGLIDASEAVRRMINAERKYRLWKARATRKGLRIERYFDDDSELSWNSGNMSEAGQ